MKENINKPLFNQLERKKKNKASAVFWKLYPKNIPKKTWDTISADVYPIPDIKQLKE